MERGKPLERRTPLRADPAKTRDFVDRSRGSLSTSRRIDSKPKPMKARTVLTAGEEHAWKTLLAVHFKAPYPASRRPCVACGRRAHGWHHPLPQQVLKRMHAVAHRAGRLGQLDHAVVMLRQALADLRAIIPLCSDCHQNHEHGSARLPCEMLPAGIWAFCSSMDALDGTEWATVKVEHAHPRAADLA